jgi:uncharacterized membrane protein YfcA
MPDHAWALVLLGLTAGVLSGMFGIGGGIVIVPALSLIFGYELQQAVGTSLGVLVFPVSFFAVLAYYRARLLHFGPAALIAAGLLGGGVIGAEIALGLPGDLLKQIYGIFLVWVGWRFSEPRKWWAERSGRPAVPAANAGETAGGTQVPWYILLGVGIGAGITSGLFGIGGGLVIVPALVAILHYDQKLAVGTSLAALLPPVGLGAVLSYYDAGKIEVASVVFIAAGLVGGAFVGARIALGLPSTTVKRLYGVFLLVVSLRFLLQL